MRDWITNKQYASLQKAKVLLSNKQSPQQVFALIDWCSKDGRKISMQYVCVFNGSTSNTKMIWSVFEIGKTYVIETAELRDALVGLAIKIKESE